MHRLEHLNRQDVVISELVIYSVEMGIYLAQVSYDDRVGFLVDADSRPQRFLSVEQVKQSLAEATIKKAWLQHQSAYDEMIGGPEKVDNSLRIPV
ncbi:MULTISPECIES: DUF6482 family protein [Rheinheimera]|jgi:hypothetical protein|uniref:DUF6482 family protein n=1 Tax=Rheinheimera TaxID=67575 RepID=UPI001E5E50AC|nr:MULTISPECIES: DUF6482 family protein [Rheinheimera]HJS14398.1 DUF6482 family protein [Rheinheimera sp.]